MKNSTTLLLLFLSVCGFCSVAEARNPRGGRGMGFHTGQKDCRNILHGELDLNKEQGEKLAAIRSEHQVEMRKLSKKTGDLGLALKQSLFSPKADEKQARTIADDLARIYKDRLQLRINHILKVRTILTEEQVRKLQASQLWSKCGQAAITDNSDNGETGGTPPCFGSPRQ